MEDLDQIEWLISQDTLRKQVHLSLAGRRDSFNMRYQHQVGLKKHQIRKVYQQAKILKQKMRERLGGRKLMTYGK